MKKERATTSDEQRERTLIAEQIERAAAEKASGSSDDSPPPPEELALKRDEGEKVVLSFAPKVTAASTSASTMAPIGGLKLNPLKAAANPLKMNALKANPLKRPNPLKQAASSSAEAGKKRDASEMSAVGRLMLEDQERKRRKMEREAQAVA